VCLAEIKGPTVFTPTAAYEEWQILDSIRSWGMCCNFQGYWLVT